MMKLLRITVLSLPALCLALLAAGQAPVRDYRYALETSGPWLQSGNAAALSVLGNEAFSVAALSFSKDNGALVPLDASEDCWTAGASTESYRRVSGKLVFSGRLGYSYFRGQNMGAQILTDPLYNPVNFLEADLSTTGVKMQEDYAMGGGVSWSPSERWSAGCQMDYDASDRTKHKDPRFRTVWMDFRSSPGVYFRPSEKLSFGANIIFRHTIEQLKAQLFGTVDREYSILVDQGAFYGFTERFEGDAGYVSAQNDRPMTNDFAGLSLQMRTGAFYNQLTALWRMGSYGRRNSSSVVFCEFRGPELSYKGDLRLHSGGNSHILNLDASWKGLSNYTNSYSYFVEEGMDARVEYHGSNLSLSRNDLSAQLDYIFYGGEGGYLPDWVLEASADVFLRSQTTTFYPNYRNQQWLQAGAALSLERNLNISGGCLSLSAGVLFRTGGGTAADDGATAQGTSKLKSFDEYLYTQFEYDTAMRAGAGLSVTYTWLKPERCTPYIKISDDFRSLLKAPSYLGGSLRNTALVSVGVNF